MQCIQPQASQDNFMIEIALIIERKNSKNKKEQFVSEYLYIESDIPLSERNSNKKEEPKVIEIQL